MKTHIRVVGILHIIVNFMGVAIALLVLALYFGGAAALGFSSSGAGETGGVVGAGVLAGLGLVGGCVILLPCLPGFIAGIALLRFHKWARVVIIVLSVLQLFAFPVGTALGVYSLWVLLNDESQHVFKGGIT